MPGELPPHETELFFIAPIGAEGTEERRRSDGVFKYIVARAAEELGLTAVRADQIGEPGLISLQVIEHLLLSKAVVADVTGRNPNVYYELGIRHAARLPVVIISEDRDLPFDIAQLRTIFFDRQDLASADQCARDIEMQLSSALDSGGYSPVTTALDLSSLGRSNGAVERTLSEVMSTLEALSLKVDRLAKPFITSPRHLPLGILGENIRAVRMVRKMSTEELADQVGLSRSALSAIERGERRVSMGLLEQLAEALDTTVGRLARNISLDEELAEEPAD